MGLTSSLLVLATLLPTQQPGTGFYRDFRNGDPLPSAMKRFGPDADLHVKMEKGGVRITLPADRSSKDPVGVVLDSPVSGDFEITTAYELVEANRPKTGYGIGYELFVETKTPTREALGVYRSVQVDKGDTFMISRNTTKDGKRQFKQQHSPATSASGRLRVHRTGSSVTVSVADGLDGELREFWHGDLGNEDLKFVRLGAISGNAHEAVDVRILDLKVHSAKLLDVAEPTPSFTVLGDASQKGAGRGWLVFGVILGLAVASLFIVAVRFYLRQRKGANRAHTERGAL